jgi:hypothetical protein
MTTIIAGSFEQQDSAQHAIEELQQAGFPADHISTFYVNPAGQHNAYPVGGDHDKSAGAEDSNKGWVAGAATGGTIGAVAGAATSPVTGPIGPAVGAALGAHVGGLVGSLSQMKDDGEEAEEETPPVRLAGVYVATTLPDVCMEEPAVHIFRSCGARSIERAQGTIKDGNWTDFDPASYLHLIMPSDQSNTPASTSTTARKG